MVTSKPDFSVCICVKNGERYLDRCLSSIFSDSSALIFPIIVVDHASSDKTSDILKSWKAKQEKRIRVIRFDGVGLAAARNVAWRNSNTSWVAFVDVDTSLISGWSGAVESAIENLHQNNKCGAIAGNNLIPEGSDLIFGAYKVFIASYVGGHNSVLNRFISNRIKIRHVPTVNSVYRRTALEEVDGFDEEFTRVAEDIDLSYRLREKGYEIWCEPGMQIYHYLRPNLKSWLKNMFLYGRGRAFFFLKRPKGIEFKFLLPSIVLIIYLVSVFFNLFTVLFLGHYIGVLLATLTSARIVKASMKEWLYAGFLGVLTHGFYGAGFLFQALKKNQ